MKGPEFDSGPLDTPLKDGLAALHLDAGDAERAQLLSYLRTLSQWSRKHNLTAHREPMAMLVHHLLDSATAIAFVRGRYCVDVGSGAGFPGIVIACLRPALEVTLLDSVERKMSFCRHASATAGIRNVRCVHGRVEHFEPERRADTIVARAFTSLARLFELSRGFLSDNGRIVAMKGRRDDGELAAAEAAGADVEVVRVQTPGLDAERHVVLMRRRDARECAA
ncbi:MAG: 16S rRNA (guanine(527)-N(7))-methyltransferase RsmG [Pseudomonadota bacterium]